MRQGAIMAACLMTQLFYFRLERFILMHLVLEKPQRHLGLGAQTCGRQQVGVGKLIAVIAKILHLDQPTIEKAFQAIVGLAQTYSELSRELALAQSRVHFQQAQQFEVMFV